MFSLEEEEFAKSSEMDQMKMQMPQAGGMPGQPPDYGKIFKSEKGSLVVFGKRCLTVFFLENIEIIKHEFFLNSAEDQAITKLKSELKL